MIRHAHEWCDHVTCDDDMVVTQERVCFECGAHTVESWALGQAPAAVQAEVVRGTVATIHNLQPDNASFAWDTLDRVLGLWESEVLSGEVLERRLRAMTVLVLASAFALGVSVILVAIL